MCLCAWDHISAKLERIREIKVYLESEEHTRLFDYLSKEGYFGLNKIMNHGKN